jgi:hypothetical protein
MKHFYVSLVVLEVVGQTSHAPELLCCAQSTFCHLLLVVKEEAFHLTLDEW